MTRADRFQRVYEICEEECAKSGIAEIIQRRVLAEVDGCSMNEDGRTLPYAAVSGPMPLGEMTYDPKRTAVMMVLPLGDFNFPNE